MKYLIYAIITVILGIWSIGKDREISKFYRQYARKIEGRVVGFSQEKINSPFARRKNRRLKPNVYEYTVTLKVPGDNEFITVKTNMIIARKFKEKEQYATVYCIPETIPLDGMNLKRIVFDFDVHGKWEYILFTAIFALLTITFLVLFYIRVF
jgi:hypothetical protein